jgi:hypothetical protein
VRLTKYGLRCGVHLAFGRRLIVVLLIRMTTGKSDMPSKINLYQIGVWVCVGFFTGAGWAFAAWLVGRIFSHI